MTTRCTGVAASVAEDMMAVVAVERRGQEGHVGGGTRSSRCGWEARAAFTTAPALRPPKTWRTRHVRWVQGVEWLPVVLWRRQRRTSPVGVGRLQCQAPRYATAAAAPGRPPPDGRRGAWGDSETAIDGEGGIGALVSALWERTEAKDAPGAWQCFGRLREAAQEERATGWCPLVPNRLSNQLISLLLRDGQMERALQVYQAMRAGGATRGLFEPPSVATYSMLMAKAGKTGGTASRRRLGGGMHGGWSDAPAEGQWALRRSAVASAQALTSEADAARVGELAQAMERALTTEGDARARGPMSMSMDGGVAVRSAPVSGASAVAFAWSLYQTMLEDGLEPDTRAMNALLAACASAGAVAAADAVFAEMQRRRVPPSTITYNTLISACRQMIARGNAATMTRPVQLAAERHAPPSSAATTGDTDRAQEALRRAFRYFREMCAASGRTDAAAAAAAAAEPNHVTYTTLIDVCGRAGHPDRALAVFQQMRRVGIAPNVHTYTSLIDALGRAGRLAEALRLLREMRQQSPPVVPNVYTYTALVDACGKHHKLALALRLFAIMTERERIVPNAVTWTALIDCAGKSGDIDLACRLFRRMRQAQCPPTEVTFTSLLHACSKCGRVDEALRLFAEMREQGLRIAPRDYAELVRGLRRANDLAGAFAMFHQMLPACASEQEVEEGAAEADHGRERQSSERVARAFRTLLEACGEAGELDMAFDVFNTLRHSDTEVGRALSASGSAWTALLSACGSARNVVRAALVFTEMRRAGIAPDETAYSELLEVCRSAQDVEAAVGVFEDMRAEGIQPSLRTFTSLMRTIGARNGLDEARAETSPPAAAPVSPSAAVAGDDRQRRDVRVQEHSLIQVFLLFYEMAHSGVRPDRVAYNSLIDACARAGDADRALQVLADMRAAGHSPNTISYTTAMQACGNAGQYERALEAFQQWRRRDDAPRPNQVTYATVIEAAVRRHALRGDVDAGVTEALQWLQRMETEDGVVPDTTVLHALVRTAVETSMGADAEATENPMSSRATSAKLSTAALRVLMDAVNAVIERHELMLLPKTRSLLCTACRTAGISCRNEKWFVDEASVFGAAHRPQHPRRTRLS